MTTLRDYQSAAVAAVRTKLFTERKRAVVLQLPTGGGIIYKATNDTNGKVYIGQTIQTLNERIRQHLRDTNRKKQHFYYSLIKYGADNFTWEIIDTAKNQEELDAKEKYWITYYKANDPAYGYNLRGGGKAGKQSKISRQRLSEAIEGHVVTAETRNKISNSLKGEKNPNFGKKFSPEHCRKISKSNKGRQPTEKTKRKFSKTMTGYKWSEEALAKRKAVLQRPETRRKMSDAHKGKQAGEKNPHASISNEIAKLIKIDIANGMRTVDITKKYNIGRGVVNGIKRGGWVNVA